MVGVESHLFCRITSIIQSCTKAHWMAYFVLFCEWFFSSFMGYITS